MSEPEPPAGNTEKLARCWELKNKIMNVHCQSEFLSVCLACLKRVFILS